MLGNKGYRTPKPKNRAARDSTSQCKIGNEAATIHGSDPTWSWASMSKIRSQAASAPSISRYMRRNNAKMSRN